VMRLALLLLATVMAAGAALAQMGAGDAGWPSKPIHFIVPFPAGSSTDIVARIVGQRLSDRLGQQVVVDNRAGASGNLGSDAVARSAPDGYTIGLATTSTHAVAASLNANLPYDPVKDFAPVSFIGSSPYVLATYPGVSAKSVAELIALARARPRMLNYASAGPASLAHLAGALFESLAGVELTHVPYRSSNQAVLDLTEGRIEMQFGSLAPTLPYIAAGKMRALAVTGAKRSDSLPDVPTIIEGGIAGYEVSLWMAIVMPAATAPGVVLRLNREVSAILATAETKAALIAQGMEPESSTPEALGARIRGDIEKWRIVIAKAGIRAE
jgi:tripartite-type tricarboxylate transporter receptor subunit TctC